MADRKLRVGFVGCGGISRMYVDIYAGLADVARVVAMSDLVPALASERAAQMTEAYHAEAHRHRALAHGAAKPAQRAAALAQAEDAAAAAADPIHIYPDHEALLRDPAIEAIVQLTAPSVRAGPTVAAAESGRHVFSQGPLARSVAEADAIRAAVAKAGIKFHSQVGSRYARGVVHAQRAVASGLIGRMAFARVDLNNYRPQSYFAAKWHGTWAGEGGTATFHHGRYAIDPFLWVVGSPVVEVMAYASAYLRQIETEDLSAAILTFANGAVGMLQASLLHHKNPKLPRYRAEVVGHDASLVFHQDYAPANAPSVMLGARENAWQADIAFGATDRPELVDRLEALAEDVDAPERASEIHQSRLWINSILNDTPPLVPIDIPWRHLELTRAIYKSQEIRGAVTLPLDRTDPFYTFDGRLTHGKKKPA